MLMEYVLNPTLFPIVTITKDTMQLLEPVFALLELNTLMENAELLLLVLIMLSTMELFVFAKLDIS